MLLDVYMKEKIKIGTKELIKYIVYGIIIWFAIGGFVTLLNNEMGCEYCTDPVNTYDYGTDTSLRSSELYSVHKEETAVYALYRLETSERIEWFLCTEDSWHYHEGEEGNFPPSLFTSYYWIEVEHCPWCGRELD